MQSSPARDRRFGTGEGARQSTAEGMVNSPWKGRVPAQSEPSPRKRLRGEQVKNLGPTRRASG